MAENTFTANSIRNKLATKSVVINQPKESNFCNCYNKENIDARCCGACYYCGDYIYCKNENLWCYKCCSEDCNYCFNNPNEYFKSGCFQTSSGPGIETDCLCTLFAGIILCKFALTFPFLLCSFCNGTLNCICNTNRNYLF